MYGYIYITTNLINNYVYIGQKRSDKFLQNEYLGSGKLLKLAVQKYGADNFSVKLLKECSNQLELDEAEKYYIELYRKELGYNKCYNISGGGLTIRSWNKGLKGIYSDETIKKMSEARKKKMSDPKERQRISNALKGHPLSEERKKNISIATKQAMQRPGVKEKIIGKNHYHFEKGHKAWNKGKPAHNKGKKFNKETRKYE